MRGTDASGRMPFDRRLDRNDEACFPDGGPIRFPRGCVRRLLLGVAAALGLTLCGSSAFGQTAPPAAPPEELPPPKVVSPQAARDAAAPQPAGPKAAASPSGPAAPVGPPAGKEPLAPKADVKVPPPPPPMGESGKLAEPPPQEEPRQYYSDWQENKAEKYVYKFYYYKPHPADLGYRKQFVCYFPTRPDYLYFYDPRAKHFWGRLLRNPLDEARRFSTIPLADRRAKVGDIPEPAYTDLGPMPSIPGSSDGVKISAPTDREAPVVAQRPSEDDVPVGTVIVEQPANGVVINRPKRITTRVLEVPKPAYREEEVTVYEDRWIPQVTYSQILVGGRPILVPVQYGYWTKVAYKKKVMVPNN